MWHCYKCKEGSKINQIFMAILINMTIFSYGTAIGWTSPMILLLQSKDSPRGVPMTDQEISWMVSACFLVSVPSNFVFAYILDKWGRKISVLIVSSNLAACWIIKLLSMNVWAFIIARSLVGVAMAGCYIVTLVYIKEISEVKMRGTLCSLGILLQTLGNLLLFILGDLLSYRTVLWFCLSIPAAHLLLFATMPESPAYLIKKGQIDEAVRVVSWLRSRKETDPVVVEDMQLLEKEQQATQENKKFIIRTIFSDKLLRRAFCMAIVLSVTREACGTIPVINFAGDIFKIASEGGSKLSLRPNEQAMLLGAVQVFGCILASTLIEIAGRKPLLIATSFISGLSMLILASWFLARSNGFNFLPWVPIATLCVCIFCDASGFQPICFVILSELFAFRYRSVVIALTMAISDTVDFVQMFFFKQINSSVGPHLPFYFFAAVCLFTSVYVWVIVPETKMKGLNEIYEGLKTKKERRLELK